MKINSISSRLLLASTLLLPLFLGLTGFFLLKAFQNSLTVAEDARLRGHIYLLFSVAELVEDEGIANIPTLQMPAHLKEPDFERINSGLYAYIYDRNGSLVWRSDSAALLEPPVATDFSASTNIGKLITQPIKLANRTLFSAHYDVVWEDAQGRGHPYRFAIAHTRTTFNAELRAYRSQLWRWLGTAALLLLIAQTAILRWGLRPLNKLAIALKAMQSGETGNIAGEHPRELQEIVANLNQVLAREKALRQRYRNSLSDLAHSLKTPLAVLQSKLTTDISESDLHETLAEQVTRMNQVVTYQLQRAVSDQQQGIHSHTDVEHAVQRLLSALRKVYRDKPIDCNTVIITGTIFAGDEQDLLEILGNILDNAFKYCSQRVDIHARCTRDNLVIRIGDDGPGIPAEERTRILQRGQRLDTTLAGQGIGLAVVVDIVNSYGGNLSIGTSAWQGAEFCLELPLAHPLTA
jgi:two-component system sensor histidine kinase PhoQ